MLPARTLEGGAVVHHMTHTLMLFDIDGTLVDTGGAGRRAMQAAAARQFGEDFSFKHVNFAGKLDGAIFTEAAARHGLDQIDTHERIFRREYVRELGDELVRTRQRVHALPGVAALLDTLRKRSDNGGDVMLGLLTGNYADAAPVKLHAVGIDPAWFPVTAFGDEGPTRPDLTALAMRRYAQRTGRDADPRRVMVIGDTPRDVQCAKAHGCVAFCVATGEHTVEQLLEAGADHAIPDFTDPSPLLSLIE